MVCLNAVDDGFSELLALEGGESNKRKSAAMACIPWAIQLRIGSDSSRNRASREADIVANKEKCP